MKNQLLKMLTMTSLSLLPFMGANAQTYCVPPPFTTGPFTGIVNVNLETLNNNSPYTDGYKFFDQVAAPELSAGQSYTITVTTEHHILGGGFSDKLNTAVWIDWNQDGEFDESSEQVLWSEAADPGVISATFSVPAGATNGETRMRVYEDMPPVDGHEPVNPCGYLNSGNGLGQHGECEDYMVNVTGGATGISDVWSVVSDVQVAPNPAQQSTHLTVNLKTATNMKVSLMDIQGREVLQVANLDRVQGKQVITLPISTLEPGTYLVSIATDVGVVTRKLLIQ